MDLNIKKDLVSNWFKLLQNAICNDIISLENSRVKFTTTAWKKNQIKDELIQFNCIYNKKFKKWIPLTKV